MFDTLFFFDSSRTFVQCVSIFDRDKMLREDNVTTELV